MSAERQLSTVISINVTTPHMGHISRAHEAESSPSPRGPNSSKSVKPFDGREPEGTRVTKLTRRTETKKRGGSPGKRPQARKNQKAENGKGTNMQTATTSTGYLVPTPRRVSPNSSQHTPKNEDRPTDGDEKGGKLREPGTAEEAKGEKARECAM